jgi:hypothetical protein
MERQILAAFDLPTDVFTAGVRSYNWLRGQVAKERGLWCDDPRCVRRGSRSRFTPTKDWLKLPHTPHIEYPALFYGFSQSFARALRRLIEQGVLTACTEHGGDLTVLRSQVSNS